MTEAGKKSRRGFAAMNDDKQRDLAARGGRSVPPGKRSFARDPALAAEAGRKGGGHAHSGAGTRSGSTGGTGRPED
ncbi:stress-induced protein [Roseomonas hellenica]|uniref:KGG domain-containing protein n=1 Tax=Plastoroseomonas hellenica TaxID=2687306 RepID=UPI002013A23C|nr:KGG domain-containing protein [Plastoroseomonas hellenica]MBR0644131.1 stress-induced protein [Plastoroseomonas hellenica]